MPSIDDRRIVVVVGREETDREDVLDVLRCRNSVMEALEKSGYEAIPVDITREDFSSYESLIMKILQYEPACVFNLFEGFSNSPFMEAWFAALLESLGMPFTGNGSRALANCLDKAIAREMLRRAGLPIAPGVCITSEKDLHKVSRLRFPLFLKPRLEDGSVGIDGDSIVYDKVDLWHLLKERLRLFPHGVIVEEYLSGLEYSAALMGVQPFEFVAAARVEYRKDLGTSTYCGFDSKWRSESIDYQKIATVIEKGISPQRRREIEQLCRRAGSVMGCQGYFRIDLREGADGLYILEVNPNPDINVDSGFTKQSEHRGYDYRSMVARLVEMAMNGRLRYVKPHKGFSSTVYRHSSSDKRLLGSRS